VSFLNRVIASATKFAPHHQAYKHVVYAILVSPLTLATFGTDSLFSRVDWIKVIKNRRPISDPQTGNRKVICCWRNGRMLLLLKYMMMMKRRRSL